MTDIKVPRLAESISEAVLVEWLKPDGAQVRTDEAIATLETDKAAVEIAAPEAGVLRHARQPGETVRVGDVIARVEAGGAPAAEATPSSGNGARTAPPPAKPAPVAPVSSASAPSPGTGSPGPASTRSETPASIPVASGAQARTAVETAPLSPAVRRLVEEHALEPGTIEATGPGGRLLKEDVLRHLESQPKTTEPAARPATIPTVASPTTARAPASPGARGEAAAANAPPAQPPPETLAEEGAADAGEDERVVPMSRIRQRIAERLVRAQQTAAILTTFNEIDMSAAMELRAHHKEGFERRWGVRLGFMSFFTRACVLALREIPELNAEIRGTDIVYRRRVHMGVAVGTDRGLVVPVLRDAQRMGFAAIEREIARLADKAREGTLSLEELSGGTFTISNGGVYGSLLSTPILNPPQSGILGMHKIEKRPIAVGDQVMIRPMMYVALSYDHRIVDGEQAVTFLVRVKERLEDPGRMLLDV